MGSKKVALITGITGQDGSYLSEFLLSKGYVVHGIRRASSTFNSNRIQHLYKDPENKGTNFFLHYGDVLDTLGIHNLIERIEPDEVYNLAAQSHVGVSFNLAHYTSNVVGLGCIPILEAIRKLKMPTRFYQASTSELFGGTPPPQNEQSNFYPRSPYGAAKLMAYWLTVNYREAYGIHASNGILFNHESPRRGETFVTRKITRAVGQILNGSREKLHLGNLNSVRDWGFAKEYVESMWLMLQQQKSSDYVIATGIGATVKEFVQASFESVGLDWEQYVVVKNKYKRPTEVDALIGNASKAKDILGWEAKTTWKELAILMTEADVELAKTG
jgi:GDPmannose 4,6-dehydratase